MDDVTVTISGVWVRRVNSPLMLLVGALTGVSVTFAPLALFQLGRSQAGFSNPLVWLCFAVIVFVPSFYMRLAGHVIGQICKQSKNKTTAEPCAAPDRSGVAGTESA